MNNKAKIPAIVSLFSDTEGQTASLLDCEILAAREEHLRERGGGGGGLGEEARERGWGGGC